MSLITYFLRGFAEQMRPYEDAVAKNVLALIQSCPPESVSTRKELLVDFRHILATDFRKGFTEYLDFFLDEKLLMGSGRQAYETLRPLAFSTIADLVHHSRDSLTFTQISKVVYLFAKNVNDAQLPSSIQMTSVRILVNISERFNSAHHDQVNFHRDRKLLSRILRTLVLKFSTMQLQIQAVEVAQKRQDYIDSENAGGHVGEHRNLIEKLNSQLLKRSSSAGDSRRRETEAIGKLHTSNGSIMFLICLVRCVCRFRSP